MAIDMGRNHHVSNHGKITPMIDCLLSSDSLKGLEEETQPDSGYGSQESSHMGTPNVPRTANHCGLDEAVQHELRLSKTKTIMSFDYKMDDAYTARFCNIQSSIESLLVQYTRRKSLLRSNTVRHKPMAIRPMLLGNNSQDAKPYIVVFCAPEMRKRIQHFFDTDTLVRAFYKPDDPLLPSFEVAVCGCAPQLRTDGFNIDVVWDENPTELKTAGMCVVFFPPTRKTRFDNTLCGTAIRFEAQGRRRNATLGGLVKITYEDGSSAIMGLTAGHVATAVLQDDSVLDVLEEEESGDDSFVDDSDSEYNEGVSDEISVTDKDSVSSIDYCSNPWAFEKPNHQATQVTLSNSLTKALKSPHGVGQNTFPDFDWALFPFEGHFKMNELPTLADVGDRRCVTAYRQSSPAALNETPAERVILMCGSGGLKYGSMVHQPTRILIQPATEFVNAYLVSLDDGASFADGDSGTWVISQDTMELLGHLVATDFFGAAYIILACDIFRDIAQSNGITKVSLPTEAEMSTEIVATAAEDADLTRTLGTSLTTTVVSTQTSEKVDRRARNQYGNIFNTEWPYRSLPSGHLVHPKYGPNLLCLREYSPSMTLTQVDAMMRNQRGYKRAFTNADSPAKETLLKFDTAASASLALNEFVKRLPQGHRRRFILQQFATSESDLPPPIQNHDSITEEPASTLKKSRRASLGSFEPPHNYEKGDPGHETLSQSSYTTAMSPATDPLLFALSHPDSITGSQDFVFLGRQHVNPGSCASVDSGYSSLMSTNNSPSSSADLVYIPGDRVHLSEERSSRRAPGANMSDRASIRVVITEDGSSRRRARETAYYTNDAPQGLRPDTITEEYDANRAERLRMRIAIANAEIAARPTAPPIMPRTRRGRDQSPPNPSEEKKAAAATATHRTPVVDSQRERRREQYAAAAMAQRIPPVVDDEDATPILVGPKVESTSNTPATRDQAPNKTPQGRHGPRMPRRTVQHNHREESDDSGDEADLESQPRRRTRMGGVPL